ncbi:C4-dicarboxylate transporter DctQ subunit [Planktotalea frisia]|jgi:C4-dicarboxylate transporter DctQ subunit|uniref:TRAP transporter small permease protein n=1 Tax=Planktotalea frisia TaxID=696762 RepID=A0A1L9P092_9RHOB|nr:TRAP transporter small permease [Planktotalea frisia]OJI94901.1 2,3-diketo-L-gulonate TRAP transporter small permease protein YiaM [Planktotalea frisia]PZX18006.1 C4-dicarboxylate transporter DctQ subunit [Planktotalea frisia]
MSAHYQPQTALGRAVNEIEETAIALILGIMTLITFTNVILRYGFNTGLIWGLEMVSFLFAWLVLFGISYAVKVTAHLGVDAIINLFDSRVKRVLAIIAVAVCIAYAFLLLKGAWDYWAPFAGLDSTTGRWFPTGFANSRDQAWYETNDIPLPEFLRFLEASMNQGEEYEKLPRFIPYAMLPFGAALLLFRFIQAGVRIVKGTQATIIVSHEAEDDVANVAHMNKEG